MQKSIIKAVKNANIAFNEEEVNEILKDMTEEQINYTGRLGIYHSIVLIRLTRKKMYEELALEKTSVISDNLLWGPMGITSINRYSAGGVFYYRVIIDKEKVYIYGFTQEFRAISKHTKSIDELSSIWQGHTGDYGLVICDSISLKFSDGTKVVLIGRDRDTKESLYEIVEDLKTLRPDIVNRNIF